MKAFINAKIYDYHEYQENVYIIFDETIEKIGPMALFVDKHYEVIDLKGALVMPGFIAGHTHLYSAFARGMDMPFNPTSFKEVLKQMWWKIDHYLDLDMVYSSALSFGLEQIKKGTTTLIDHHAGYNIRGSLSKIKEALVTDLNARCILAFETSDRYSVDDAIKENAEFIRNNHSEFCSGLFGLHASFTLSDETLNKVKENLGDAGIHIHVAESIKDEEDCQRKYGKSVVKRLNDFDLINEKSILVHCANVTEKELQIVKEKKAIIAINITSNMNNAVGLPDVKLMEEMNLKLMIGNDGLIQSMPMEYLNVYYASHLKSRNPIGLSLDTIKKAIINSYEFVNKQLKIKVGSIKKGYKSDLIVVDYKAFTPINNQNAFGHIFFGVFPGLLPKHVFINGKQIITNYEASEALEKKNMEAKAQAHKLWQILKKEGNHLEFKD